MIVNRHGLELHGIKGSPKVNWNLSPAVLVEEAIRRGEGQLARSGALAVTTGSRTGRSPRDKFIVRDAETEKQVDWGPINAPMSPEVFDKLLAKTTAYLGRRELFVVDAHGGADAELRMPIRVVTDLAWHALFARQLFRVPTPEAMAGQSPQFVVLAAPGCRADGPADGVNSDAYVVVNFTKRIVLIGGTLYAGEIKKSIFTILNFLLPARGVLPMHCSANVGRNNDVALFFGLSGTGKTTLSADPDRRLIGDDEHGWSDRGVFNFEGGCYAKCIKLSAESEPQIYAAVRFGTVLENVVIDPQTRGEDFNDGSLTENTRAAYPIDYIPNAEPAGCVERHPQTIVFLTCDAFGVLPPISRLNTAQAMYHFLSGYTAKLAGTEAGVGSEPQATFSRCFGAPFLPRRATEYADLLARKMEKHGARCYLLNTGWSGGPFGVGSRIKLSCTRAMVHAALGGALHDAPAIADPVFGVMVPKSIPGVPTELLHPRSTWGRATDYDAKAAELAARFEANIEKMGVTSKEVRAAGPRVR